MNRSDAVLWSSARDHGVRVLVGVFVLQPPSSIGVWQMTTCVRVGVIVFVGVSVGVKVIVGVSVVVLVRVGVIVRVFVRVGVIVLVAVRVGVRVIVRVRVTV